MLAPPGDARLKQVFQEVADEHGITLHRTEVMPGHVHLLVEAGPTFCAAKVVHRLKGTSSCILRAEFPHLRLRLPTLWSRSYLAGSVGAVPEAVMRRCIEAQKGA